MGCLPSDITQKSVGLPGGERGRGPQLPLLGRHEPCNLGDSHEQGFLAITLHIYGEKALNYSSSRQQNAMR